MTPQSAPSFFTESRIASLRRLAIWAVFAALIYLLRDFLLIVFLTFVFAYAAEHALLFLEKRMPRVPRSLLTVAIFLGSMGAIAGLGIALAPKVRDEFARMKTQFPKYRDAVVGVVDWVKEKVPAVAMQLDPEQALPHFRDLPWSKVPSAAELPTWDAEVARSVKSEADLERMKHVDWSLATTLDALERQDPEARRLVERSTWFGKLRNFELQDLTQGDWSNRLGATFGTLAGVLGSILEFVVTALLALFFAFLIVLDLPAMKREIVALEGSRVGWLYNEVRSSVVEFFGSVGFILEAQAAIAVINTVLTTLGLWILGVPSIFLLGVVVFFCGLVPVLGTFVSSAPILLLALATGGVSLMLKSLALIVLVHLFETYVLEPKIFGKRFHLNSVFVILILFVGHSVAGMWGVILGLPVAYTLMRPPSRPQPYIQPATAP